MQDRINNALFYVRAGQLKFVSHCLGIVDIYDVIGKVVAYAFSDDAAGCSNCNSVVFFQAIPQRVMV